MPCCGQTCAGIQDGGRTGLTAVTVALCFIVTLPFAPVFHAVPAIATAPPLVVVGMFMMAHAKFIDWESLDEGMPAFVVVTVIPFTYSIANGLTFGLATYAIIKSATVSVRRVVGHKTSPVFHPPGADEVGGIVDPDPGVPVSPFVAKARRLRRAPSSSGRRGTVGSEREAEAEAELAAEDRAERALGLGPFDSSLKQSGGGGGSSGQGQSRSKRSGSGSGQQFPLDGDDADLQDDERTPLTKDGLQQQQQPRGGLSSQLQGQRGQQNGLAKPSYGSTAHAAT